jgi:hypothetical protein
MLMPMSYWRLRAARIGGAAGQPGRVVADVREQVARVVARLGEVALPLEQGGNAHPLRLRLRVQPVLVLLAEEEEQLGAVGVELAGYVHGTAQRIADVTLVQLRRRRVGELVALGVAAGRVAVHPGVRVEVVRAAEDVGGAVEVAAAALRDGDDLRAHRAAVLGLVVRGEDLELLHRVERQRDHGTAVVAGVHVGDAVDLDVVVAAALAVRAERGGVAGGRRLLRVGRVRGHDAGRQEGEAEEAAAIDRDVLHHLPFDGVRALGGGALQLGRRGFDRHLLGDAAHFEHERSEVEPVVRVDDDQALDRLEPVRIDLECVGVRRHRGHHEVAAGVERAREAGPAPVAHESDRRRRDHRTLSVAHRARDGAADRLRLCGRHPQRRQQQQ